MWSGFGKDIRLIKKHFRRNISRKIKADFFFNVVGFGLITSLCLSMVLQRDLAVEAFELASPFRYDSPGSIYYGVYRALKTDDVEKGEVMNNNNNNSNTNQEDKSNNKRKSARFPNRNTIPVLVTGENGENK